jgi:hypothetical protein
MVARVIRTAGFLIAFERAGEEIDAARAATGRDAVKAALLMIAHQDELQHGDRLNVTEVGE